MRHVPEAMRHLERTFFANNTSLLARLRWAPVPLQIVQIRQLVVYVTWSGADGSWTFNIRPEYPAVGESVAPSPIVVVPAFWRFQGEAQGNVSSQVAPVYFDPPLEVAGYTGIRADASIGFGTFQLNIGYTTRLVTPGEYAEILSRTSIEVDP